MADRKNLYSGLSNAAWGYFFLHVDINLGTVSIFPRFVGFLLLLSAVGRLSEERRDLRLLRPLTIFLAAWNVGDWLLSWAGQDLDGRFPLLDILTAVAQLYFHFQFLTDMASLAEVYQDLGVNLDRRLLRRRSAYILLVTAIALTGCLPTAAPWGQWRSGVVLTLALIAVFASLLIMMGLFELRRLFREGAALDS